MKRRLFFTFIVAGCILVHSSAIAAPAKDAAKNWDSKVGWQTSFNHPKITAPLLVKPFGSREGLLGNGVKRISNGNMFRKN